MINQKDNIKDEFQEMWLEKISNKQRKERIIRAFVIIKNVAEKQIKYLKKYEESKNKKEIGFMYYQNTLISIWKNVDFAISLGKGKNKQFAFYPARNVLENGFRLEYFLNQKEDGRNKIAIIEFLRVIKRAYEHEKIKDGDFEEYNNQYKYFSSITGDFPSIDDFKDSQNKSFPEIWELIRDTKLEGGSIDWYHQYRSLCEVTHGKLFRTMMASWDESSEYVWSLMYIQFMAIAILKMTDLYIYGTISKEVVETIKKAEEIIKKPI